MGRAVLDLLVVMVVAVSATALILKIVKANLKQVDVDRTAERNDTYRGTDTKPYERTKVELDAADEALVNRKLLHRAGIWWLIIVGGGLTVLILFTVFQGIWGLFNN